MDDKEKIKSLEREVELLEKIIELQWVSNPNYIYVYPLYPVYPQPYVPPPYVQPYIPITPYYGTTTGAGGMVGGYH
uniref:Uncharacterized protein n=1 Tax=viral metagenome TaxID=1070528 RepID=A0A6M3KVW0_9ZZZZ